VLQHTGYATFLCFIPIFRYIAMCGRHFVFYALSFKILRALLITGALIATLSHLRDALRAFDCYDDCDAAFDEERGLRHSIWMLILWRKRFTMMHYLISRLRQMYLCHSLPIYKASLLHAGPSLLIIDTASYRLFEPFHDILPSTLFKFHFPA